ncbi:hypothetical protein DN069_09875 [Streptacidiphilus pinicola]|uniref:Uncharacterized protein n=1 Tax=Streptacidiphilus pinicola TaxID=2219663 RepID=A0A2X0J673_9ACTN|nr:hypothetical protein [Streptacidiphilus pinicola]RAG85806.1 hypothetical protein DN069_09875 [Streptacidiphilus pinicola]
MKYRYWCGECGYKTPWADEPAGRLAQLRHYARWHAGVVPGGHRERRHRWSDVGQGCLVLLCLALLLLAALVLAWLSGH